MKILKKGDCVDVQLQNAFLVRTEVSKASLPANIAMQLFLYVNAFLWYLSDVHEIILQ